MRWERVGNVTRAPLTFRHDRKTIEKHSLTVYINYDIVYLLIITHLCENGCLGLELLVLALDRLNSV